MRPPLRVGVLFPLEGDWRWGADCVSAVRSALEIARSRVDLPDIALDVRDVADHRRAAHEAEHAIDSGAAVLLGTVFSAPALAASEVAARRSIPYWEAVAAATQLTRRGYPALFRSNTTALDYGRTAAAFLSDVGGARRVAIAEQADPFCRAITEGFLAGLATHDIRPVCHVTFARTGADHGSVVDEIASSRADAVLLVALGDNVAALWRSIGGLPRPLAPLIIGNGAWATRPVVDGGDADLDGLFVVDTPHGGMLRPELLTETGRAQLRERRAGVRGAGGPGPADADLAYLAASLLFEHVLPRVDAGDLDAFQAAARAIDIPLGGTLCGFGVRFDERGDNTRSFSIVMQWQDGERRVTYPPTSATATPRLASK